MLHLIDKHPTSIFAVDYFFVFLLWMFWFLMWYFVLYMGKWPVACFTPFAIRIHREIERKKKNQFRRQSKQNNIFWNFDSFSHYNIACAMAEITIDGSCVCIFQYYYWCLHSIWYDESCLTQREKSYMPFAHTWSVKQRNESFESINHWAWVQAQTM